jgi:hypothetical protein
VPHAHHFLERLDRVTRQQTEFALELYRDDAAIAYVLERVHLPPDAERVALSLDDPVDGPFVIVTRTGRFVTCLGRGMRVELPTVPRGQLDALLGKMAGQRARLEFAQRELRPGEEEGDLFERIISRGSRFSREDFRAVSALEPMLGLEPYTFLLDIAAETLVTGNAMILGAHRVTRMRAPTAKGLERQDRLTWAVGHLMLLTGASERKTLDDILRLAPPGSPTFACGAQGGMTFLLRAAWAAARFGKAMIPTYKQILDESPGFLEAVEAAMCLGAIGFRHAGSLGAVRRILEHHGDNAVDTGENSIPAVRDRVARAVVQAIDGAETAETTAMKIGQDFGRTYGTRLPEGHPWRFATPEEVPEDLARTAVLSFHGNVYDALCLQVTLAALPIAARAQAEDFFFPRDVVRAWLGEWTPEETLDRMRHFNEVLRPKYEPHRAAKTPGRNDPCHCGSGKKWKKCHGATA